MSKLWLMSRLPLLALACSEPEAFEVLSAQHFVLRDHRGNAVARSTLWPDAHVPYYDLPKDWGVEGEWNGEDAGRSADFRS
jgi:hypothetical protein